MSRDALVKPEKRGRGRTRSKIDLDELRKLSKLQCTIDEIAAYFDCSKRTILNRRAESDEFREAMDRAQQSGLISLRRAQFESALKGNVTAQIWLGKQYLGQKDRVANELSGPDGAALPAPVIRVEFIDPPKLLIDPPKPNDDDDSSDR